MNRGVDDKPMDRSTGPHHNFGFYDHERSMDNNTVRRGAPGTAGKLLVGSTRTSQGLEGRTTNGLVSQSLARHEESKRL